MCDVCWAGRPTRVHLPAVPMLWGQGLQGRAEHELLHMQVQAARLAGAQTSRQRSQPGAGRVMQL